MSLQDKINSSAKLARKITQLNRTDGILGSLVNKAIDSSIKIPAPDNIGKNISDFLAKKKKKNENKRDVFKELLDVVESFISTQRPTHADPNSPNISKKLVLDLTIDALNKTLNQSKQIVLDSVQKVLFVGDGICGTNKTFSELIPGGALNIKPQEVDFLNVLQVDPNTNTGKIVYEPSNETGYLKINRMMYESITGDTQNIKTKDNKDLFTMSFDPGNQEFNVTNLGIGTNVNKLQDFVSGYYSNIEFLDINDVLKNAVLMTLKGDGSEPISFDVSLNFLNRLLAKMCAYCGNSDNQGLKGDPVSQFNENDEDIESYFDFDDVEGIDIDDERDRLNKVLRFRDCNNFTIPINKSHYESFIYLDRNTKDKVEQVLYNSAVDSHNQSDSSIPLINFHINLLNSYILNLPKALIQGIMSPKYFLPILIAYKAVTNELGVVVESAKVLMKKLWKLFDEIIRRLLWNFRENFWNLAKPHLLRFLSKLVARIIINKKKRYLLIIAAIIALLTKLLSLNIGSCKSLFDAINFAIENILLGGSLGGLINVPGFLLSFSNLLGGKSTDLMKSGIYEKLENYGINTGAIFGKQTTNLQGLIAGIVDGQQDHEDNFGYVSTGNKLTVLPSPQGPIIIPPGLITCFGKSF